MPGPDSGRRPHYLNREESFMYDREVRFRLEETRNNALIEFSEKGVMHFSSRRCTLLAISRSAAILGILTQFRLPKSFYLDIPDARITKIGCVLMRVNGNNTVNVRFLRLITPKEMNRVFAYSTHPRHKDVGLSIRD